MRIGTGSVEGLHAAEFAEIMLGAQGPELVELQIVERGEKFEPRLLDVMVDEALQAAIRAIADGVRAFFKIGLNRICHLAAMALAQIVAMHQHLPCFRSMADKKKHSDENICHSRPSGATPRGEGNPFHGDRMLYSTNGC